MLWSPEAHERLVDEGWDEAQVRDAIRAIAADAEDAFDDGWPAHPLDVVPEEPGPYTGLYLGAAGVVDALYRLARRGLAELRRNYAPYVERLEPDEADDGLLLGETGVRLVLQRLAPSAANRERLRELIAANRDDERRDLVWGSPGTMLAARALGFDDLWQDSAERLRAKRDADTGLWTQRMNGAVVQYLGAGHGFAGCVLALGDEAGVAETARRFAVRDGDLANWPTHVEAYGLAAGDGTVRTQWCHGAPGIVTSLAPLLDRDLALAGAELTWRAGPLAKGASLCHGTAGNGYAFLAVLELAGDELWLERARRFALHALAQVERERRRVGRGRYSLWTGDVGTALYAADCLDGRGALPLP